MRNRTKGIICVSWIAFAILFISILEENDYFGERVERGKAVFFKDGIRISEFEEIDKILYQEIIPLGEEISLPLDGKDTTLKIQKTDGKGHLFLNGSVIAILHPSGCLCYNLGAPYSLTVETFKEFATVTLKEKSYVAKMEGWYPIPIKESFMSYKLTLKYSPDCEFIIKCTPQDSKNYDLITDFTAKENGEIVWNIREKSTGSLIPDSVSVKNRNIRIIPNISRHQSINLKARELLNPPFSTTMFLFLYILLWLSCGYTIYFGIESLFDFFSEQIKESEPKEGKP